MRADVQQRIDWIRSVKEGLVAEAAPDENDDVCPIVEGRRNNETKVLVTCHDVDKRQAFMASRIIASGVECDEIWLALDTHASNSRINPVTGKPWGMGEMQNLCDNEGACELGLITDAMVLMQETRDRSQAAFVQLPYHVHKTDRSVRWVTENDLIADSMDEDNSSVRFSGLVVDEVREAFELPLLRDALLRELRERGYDELGLELNASKVTRTEAIRLLSSVGVVAVPE